MADTRGQRDDPVSRAPANRFTYWRTGSPQPESVDQRVGTAPVSVGGVRGNPIAARGGEVKAFVEEIPGAEPRSHEVPGDPEETCPRLRVHPVGAVKKFVEQRA